MPTPNDELAEIRQEHLERVLESYRAKSKEFQRVFGGLVIFALIFLFVILLPYVSLQIEERQISDRREGLLAEMSIIAERLTVYEQAQLGVQQLHQQIQDGPQELRDHILTLERECQEQSSGPQQQTSDCPSDPAQRRTWFDQKVQEWIQKQLEGFDATIKKSVIAPLESLDDTADSIDLTALTDGLSNLESAFADKLAENPSFWTSFTAKLDFYGQLDQALDGVWSEYDSAIEAQEQELSSLLAELEAETTSLEERRVQLRTEADKVAERLSQIEFPFGKFPVGLDESVAVFPLLLSIGFFVCSSLLYDTIRARQSFHHLYQHQDPRQQVLSDQEVALVAPLLIDPIDREQHKTVKSAILAVPLVVFVAACALILYSWTIPDVSAGAQLSRWIYGTLYVCGLGLFLYGYLRIITGLRRYGET